MNKDIICMATALCAAIFSGSAAFADGIADAAGEPAHATIEATASPTAAQPKHSYAPYSSVYADPVMDPVVISAETPAEEPAVEPAVEPATESVAEAVQTATTDSNVNFARVTTDESVKWFSGSVVGSWYDGFLRKGNGRATNLNQIWLTGEKTIDTSKKGYDLGGRIDALFGTTNAQCVDGGFDGGWGVSGDGYGASIYQAYAEVGVGKLSAKIGKFATIIGYEAVDSVPCAFNTHTYMFNHEPTSHSGVLFNYAPDDVFSFDFGMVSGFDNSFGNRNGDTGFLFGATIAASDALSLNYSSALMQTHNAESDIFHYSYAERFGGLPLPNMNQYLQSVTLDSKLNDQLSVALTTNYGTWEDRETKEELYRQVGVAGYVFYKLTDKLDANVRYEYYSQKILPAQKIGISGKGRYHDLGAALYYRPTENIFLRPEARYDWAVEEEKDSGFTGGVAFGMTF